MYISLVHGTGINPALKAAPDESLSLGPLELYNLCTTKFRQNVGAPERTTKLGAPPGPMLELGRRNGGPNIAELHGPDPHDACHKLAYLLEAGDSARYAIYRGRDPEQLKKVAACYHGAVEWLPI